MRPRISVLVLVAAVAAVGLVATACGESQKVGSERLLEFEEGPGGPRLGERTAAPEETQQPLTVGETPAPTPEPTPEPTAAYFDVALVADSPYYQPGNRLSIRRGVTIRVTNEDGTAERSKGRSFTDKNGAFHSGLLAPGRSWTWTFTALGSYEIIDEGLTFATAYLEVVP